MRVRVIERDVMNPLADTSMKKIPVNAVGCLESVGLFDNTKPGADIILKTIESEFAEFNIIWSQKPAGAAASQKQLDRVKKANLCILALGDCGSCTTWVVLDAIRLEKEGIPTISVCSDKFADYARGLAAAHGMPDLRIVEIEHPIAGIDPDLVIKKTEKIIGSIKNYIG